MNHKLAGSKGRFYPFDRGKHLKVVVELRAYGDESGTHENPPYCLETISKLVAKITVVRKDDIALRVTPILTFPHQGGRDF